MVDVYGIWHTEADDIVGNSCRLLALVKRVHVLVQTKSQVAAVLQ